MKMFHSTQINKTFTKAIMKVRGMNKIVGVYINIMETF